jgi:hypothetical protein
MAGRTASCCGSDPSARQPNQGGTLAETLTFPRFAVFLFGILFAVLVLLRDDSEPRPAQRGARAATIEEEIRS